MLNLHSGGEEVTYDALRQLPVPEPTASHYPIAHYRIRDALVNTLGNYGHHVISERHAVAHEGHRYFGLLSLKSDYDGYEDVCGLRNSNDKSFPIGIAFGGEVFVCSNLSFYGDHIIKRKHTKAAWRDVNGLLAEIIEPLKEQREHQHQTFERYKLTPLSDQTADHVILQLYRDGVLNVNRIADVIQQWEAPDHDWGNRTAWHLFNCVTFALAGKIAENPTSTRMLHQAIDHVC